MYLTKREARNALVSKVPTVSSNEIDFFIKLLYQQSNEMDLGDLLEEYFKYWQWAGDVMDGMEEA